MNKNILSKLLVNRIILWRCTPFEDEGGDRKWIWSPEGTCWAHCRIKRWGHHDEKIKSVIEVTMRPMPYKFQGIEWNKQCYKVGSNIWKDQSQGIWRFQAYEAKAGRFNER